MRHRRLNDNDRQADQLRRVEPWIKDVTKHRATMTDEEKRAEFEMLEEIRDVPTPAEIAQMEQDKANAPWHPNVDEEFLAQVLWEKDIGEEWLRAYNDRQWEVDSHGNIQVDDEHDYPNAAEICGDEEEGLTWALREADTSDAERDSFVRKFEEAEREKIWEEAHADELKLAAEIEDKADKLIRGLGPRSRESEGRV